MTVLNIVKTILGFVFNFKSLEVPGELADAGGSNTKGLINQATPASQGLATTIDNPLRRLKPAATDKGEYQPVSEKTEVCPYCQGKDIVKKGTREKKLETVKYILWTINPGPGGKNRWSS